MSLPPPSAWVRCAASRTPDATAVVIGGDAVTYEELDRLAARSGPTTESPVTVAADRSLATVVRLWSAWGRMEVAVVHDPEQPVQESLQVPGTGDHTWVPTSGSTGGPRIVRLTAANVHAAVEASQTRLGNDRFDRWLLTLPLFHVGGLSVLWRSAAAGGAVVLHDRFDAEEVAEAMVRGDVTMASLVPTMLHRLLAVLDGPVEGMRAILVGGGAVHTRLVEEAWERGLPVVPTYGSTETCSQVSTVAPGVGGKALGTAGRPLPGFAVEIDRPDETGAGEIVVSGPAVSPGYVGEPSRSGPHRTGDLGRIDDEGRLVVLGRTDDVIVTGGEKVVPGDVEAVLATHPAVAEVAVFGVPDEEWGEIVAAAIVASGPVDAATLRSWVADRLRRCEVPRRLRMVDALPLLPTGKIDRRSLVAEYE